MILFASSSPASASVLMISLRVSLASSSVTLSPQGGGSERWRVSVCSLESATGRSRVSTHSL